MRAATLIAILILLHAPPRLVGPLVTEAQAADKVPRIGVLGGFSPTHPFVAAFRQGLRELGYIEGQSIVVEYRHSHGALDRAAHFPAELVPLKSDILVVRGTESAPLTQALT